MPFLPVRYDSGKMTKVKQVASTTVTKGDALVDDGNGNYNRATSSSALIPYVAWEGQTTGSATADLLVLETRGIEFLADTNAAPEQTDIGTIADLTDHDTLNESSSSVDVFFIKSIRGAVADKKVTGFFTQHEGTIS